YTLTNDAVVDLWVELKKGGSDVRVLLDLTQTRSVEDEENQIKKLQQARIPYRIGHSPKKSAIMHEKFTACNGAWVEDGSWNYTEAADDQANTLNFNTVPSRMRFDNFKTAWDELWQDFGEQEERRAKRRH